MESSVRKEAISESSLAGNRPAIQSEDNSVSQLAYSEEDELLFHMSQVGDDALSPTSKKIIEKNTVPFTATPSGAKKEMPFTIQRPSRSGSTVLDFGYANPSQTDVTFSFRPPPGRQSNVSKRSNPGTERQRQKPLALEDENVSTGNEAASYGSPNPDGLLERPDQAREYSAPEHQALIATGNGGLTQERPGANGDDAPGEQGHSTTDPQDQTESIRSEKQCISKTHTREYETAGGPVLPTPLTTRKYKVTKNRKKQRSRVGGSRRESPILSNDDSRPSEEDLFYLLIQRLRQREEQEASNSALREQMKSDIVELSEENQSLRAQMEQCRSRQEEQEIEIDTRKRQSEHWKMKLSKLRRVLNGLGKEFKILRDEANDLKRTEAGLLQEKSELVKCLDEIKVNIDQASRKVSQQPAHVAAITADFNVMTQALRSAQDKTSYYHDRLLYEQRRVSKLERYIQSSANEHSLQLKFTKDMQSQVLGRLDTAIEHVKQRWESSQDILQSAIPPVLQECLESVNVLLQKNTVEKSDIRDLNQSLATQISSLEALVTNSVGNLDITKEIQNVISTEMHGQLQRVEDVMSSSLITSHEFADARERQGRLEEKLKTSEETVLKLREITKELKLRETELTGESMRLKESLADCEREMNDAAIKSREDMFPTVPELQIQLQTTSAALTEALESIKDKESQIETLQQGLVETRLNTANAEERLEQLEREKATLKDEMCHMEAKIREELGRASVIARDKIKAQFEQQLHRAQKEKTALQTGAQKLEQTISELKAIISQSEDKSSVKQREMEENLAAREEDIRYLQHRLAECEARAVSLETELGEYRQQGMPGQEAGAGTEGRPVENSEELQKRIDVLEGQLSGAQGEIRSVSERLVTAESAKSALESGKARAKSEMHSLLHRIQESESWKKEGESVLQKLGIIESGNPPQVSWPIIEGRLNEMLDTRVQKTPNTRQEKVRHISNDIQSREFVRTEVVYRSESVHASGHTSPSPHVTFQAQVSASGPADGSSRRLPSSIVPFSHVQNAITHVPCSPSESLSDIRIQLPSTPQEGLSEKEGHYTLAAGKEISTAKSAHDAEKEITGKHMPDKSAAALDHHHVAGKQTPRREEQNAPNLKGDGETKSRLDPAATKKTGIKRKSRGQLTQDSLTSVDSPSVSASRNGESPIHNQSEANYRIKRGEAPKGILKGSTTLMESNIQKGAAIKTPERPRNKRAKRYGTSVADSLSVTDTPTVSGYFDNGASPLISASGSQRPKRRDHQHHLPATRSTTRGRRRSRGEYYGDRFNREIQASK
ncbi:hypothetical protein DTO217A2_4642 [Paecilomyces variotii]|nr:hypothetical protein DTO217A2_4642 [Paecilomyces variotii]